MDTPHPLRGNECASPLVPLFPFLLLLLPSLCRLPLALSSYPPSSIPLPLFSSLPRPIMIQTDVSRLINSDEIQKIVRPIRYFKSWEIFSSLKHGMGDEMHKLWSCTPWVNPLLIVPSPGQNLGEHRRRRTHYVTWMSCFAWIHMQRPSAGTSCCWRWGGGKRRLNKWIKSGVSRSEQF